MATTLNHPHSSGNPCNRVLLAILHLSEERAGGGNAVIKGGTKRGANKSKLHQETGLEAYVINDVLSKLSIDGLVNLSSHIISLTDNGEIKAKKMRSSRSYYN